MHPTTIDQFRTMTRLCYTFTQQMPPAKCMQQKQLLSINMQNCQQMTTAICIPHIHRPATVSNLLTYLLTYLLIQNFVYLILYAHYVFHMNEVLTEITTKFMQN